MTRLRVVYRRPFDLVSDHDGQWTRGGLLVRVDPPPGLALYEAIELEIVTPDGASHVSQGQVVQMIPGAGVAVAFAVAPSLAAAVEAARSAQAIVGDGAAPTHSIVTEAAAAPPPPRPVAAPAQKPGGGVAEKIQIALHGNKDERAAILRDNNKMLHAYVLKNPNLQQDEILMMAKMTTVSPEVLRQISERREWAQRPEIAIALVRNPKTPTPIAVKLVDYVAPAELRQLAKDTKTRPPVQQAARKKVFG